MGFDRGGFGGQSGKGNSPTWQQGERREGTQALDPGRRLKGIVRRVRDAVLVRGVFRIGVLGVRGRRVIFIRVRDGDVELNGVADAARHEPKAEQQDLVHAVAARSSHHGILCKAPPNVKQGRTKRTWGGVPGLPETLR